MKQKEIKKKKSLKKRKKKERKKVKKKKKREQELHKKMASQKSLCEVMNHPMVCFHIVLQVQVLMYTVRSFCKFRYCRTPYSPVQSFCKFRYCHTLFDNPFASSGTAIHCSVLLPPCCLHYPQSTTCSLPV